VSVGRLTAVNEDLQEINRNMTQGKCMRNRTRLAVIPISLMQESRGNDCVVHGLVPWYCYPLRLFFKRGMVNNEPNDEILPRHSYHIAGSKTDRQYF
jgi:hypothetical protein